MAPRFLGWVFVKTVLVPTNTGVQKRIGCLQEYKEIRFEYAQCKVLEGLPNLDVQYADLCVGLLHRRRWMLRREFANHFNRNGSLKHWRNKGDPGRISDKEVS